MAKTANKNQKSINFYEGRICIRDKNGKLIFQDDSCIEEISEKIKYYITDNPKIFQINTIIFDVLKEHFKIYKLFRPDGACSIIPSEDPLYNCFSNYIRRNPIYSNRIEQQRKLKNENYKKIKEKS